MTTRIDALKVGLDEDLEERLHWLIPDYASYKIVRQSVDARARHIPHFVYTLDVFKPGESASPPVPDLGPKLTLQQKSSFGEPVLIIGSGPAGLFAALRLVERGVPCHLFEQGHETAQRIRDIAQFWRYGKFHPRSNVGFGEGGAGLFSDGKLMTRIKSVHIPYVLNRLVQFGAPEEIVYQANPHVGSDRIRRLIPRLRAYLQEQGCQIHLQSKVVELLTQNQTLTGLKTESGEIFKSSRVILACGHSAEDMFIHLSELGVALEGKSFAVGLRVEHPQTHINRLQYRDYAEHPKLGAANYRLTHHSPKANVGVYSFCMCPGGYVLASHTAFDHVVCNGMSNFKRNSPFANSAIVVSVDYQSYFGSSKQNVFAGLKWRQNIERQAFEFVRSQSVKTGARSTAADLSALPAQRLVDFLERKSGPLLESSSPSGVVPARLDQVFDSTLLSALEKGFQQFEQKMPGFVGPQALLHGVETRTSCPLRIPRHPRTLESISHRGLYPTGEGAGYAGGITSAACDGVRVAEQIVEQYLQTQAPTVKSAE